jgi:hypothetical protein
MAERFYADHTTTETGEDIRVEIHDSDFVGSASKLKGTGAGWASRSVQQLDPRNPLSSPVQKSEVSVSLWVESSSLIDDLFSSEEGRFTLIYDKDSTEYFEGTILPDLCDYDYLEDSALWKLTIKAKDLSILEGEYYTDDGTISGALETGRVTVIEAIADILPYSKTIKTHTSWIVDGTTTSNDYLRQVYIDKYALRTYARTGDESDEPITKLTALEWILKSNGLILKQENGWVLDHITAMSNPASVLESNYDTSGTFSSASNVDLTNTATIVIGSPYNHNPGIKSARLKYDHRTKISGIVYPSVIELVDAGTDSFSQLFISDGSQTLSLSFTVNAETDETEASMDARVRITSGSYYLQDDLSWDTTVNSYVEFSLTKGKPLSGGGNVWRGSFSITTDDIPDAADGTLTVQFAGATGGIDFADTTEYYDIGFSINNSVAQEKSTYIDYQLTQTGTQSVRAGYGSVYFGDGPVGYSRGAITTDSGGTAFTADDWARRGEVSFVNHAEILLRELLDVQRKSRNRISATVKSGLSFGDIISYDSTNYYVLGGSQDGYTGVSKVELLEVDIQTGTDTFEDLPKFEEEAVSGSASTSGGTGLDVTTADARYLKQTSNLSDIDDASTGRTNLGVAIGSDVQGHSDALDDISLLDDSDGNFIVGSATGWVAESGATARASLGANDASNLTTGTLPSGRVSGSYTGITGVGALNAGSISSGFGAIDIGSSTLTAGAAQIIGDASLAQILVTTNANSGESRLRLRPDNGLQGGLDLIADETNKEAIIQTNNSALWDLIFKIRGSDGTNERFRIAKDVITSTVNLNIGSNALTAGAAQIIGDASLAQILVTTNANSGESRLRLRPDNGLQGGLDLIADETNKEAIIQTNNSALWDLIFKIRGSDGTNERFRIAKDVITSTVNLNIGSNALTAGTGTFGGTVSVDRAVVIRDAGDTQASSLSLYESGSIDVLLRSDTGTSYLCATGGELAVGGASQLGSAKLSVHGALTASGLGTLNSLGVTTTSTFGGNATFESNLFIEGGLFAREFIVDVTKVQFDNLMTVGGGKVASVSGSAGSETITFEDENGTEIVPVGLDDIVHIQVRSGTTFGTIVKNIYRRVDNIATNDIELTTSGITWTTGDDVGSIEVGDDIFVQGNPTDADRDHYIKFDISGVTVPRVSVFDNVIDVDDDGDLRMVWGGMDGVFGVTGDEIGIGVGDSTLSGNHFLLTDSQASLKLDNYALSAGTGSAIIGMQSGNASDEAWLWGGSNQTDGASVTNANTKFFVLNNGKIVYNGMGKIIYSPMQVADYGSDTAEASDPQNSEWTCLAQTSGVGNSDSDSRVAIVSRFRKQFGLDNINVNFFAEYARTSSSTALYTNEVQVVIKTVAGVTQSTSTYTVTGSTHSEFDEDIDISALTDGDIYSIEVIRYADVEINSGDEFDTATNRTNLRGDVYITTSPE